MKATLKIKQVIAIFSVAYPEFSISDITSKFFNDLPKKPN